MRARPCSLLVVAGLSLAPFAASADDATPGMDSHWYFAPFAGYHVFDSDWGESIHWLPSVEAKEGIHAGGRFGYVWANGLGLELAGGWTSSKLDSGGTDLADMTWYHGSANLIFSPAPGRFGSPFLSAGFGVGSASLSDPPVGLSFAPVSGELGDENFNMGLLDVAAGWTLPMGEKLGLRLEARNLLWIPEEKWDNANVAQQIYGGSLVWNFGGKPKDDDADGVPNRRDQCPDTPAGAVVDLNGCPLDGDGDGVYDGLDQCPGTPTGAKVNAQGCPTDGDGDGVWDGIDQCPDTPTGATVNAQGCPTDADGDGVWDGIDQCDNTPTGARVDARGCPMDGDGDGVFDGLDKCPRTPANLKVDVDGCPIEITERETELLDTGMIRLQDVNFETARAEILPESHGSLDIVGALLTKWPQLQIEVGGHTDSRGSASYNQSLSEERANAVLEYLTQNFPDLQMAQFTARGYGESKPVAPNTSAANMAKNRRVEFVVLNKDVLKQEREKRKMLEK